MALLVTVCVAYLALLVTGLWLISRYLCTRLFTLPEARAPKPPLRPPWTALDAVEVAAVLLAGVVVAGLVVGATSVRLRLEETAPWALPALALVSYLAFCAPALLLVRKRVRAFPGVPLRQLGLGGRPGGPAVSQALTAYGVGLAALGLAWLVVSYLAQDLTGPMATSPIDMVQHAGSAPALLVYFVLICIIAPMVEEVIFRGFVFAGLRGQFSLIVALALSAVMFAAAHLNMAPGGMLAVAGIGVVLAYLYEHTRSLWPSIFLHAIHNALSFALIVIINL